VQVPHISVYNLPTPSDPWTTWAAIAQVLSTLIALVAVLFALWTIRQNRQTIQLQVLESVMHDIRDLFFKYEQEYKSRPEPEKRAWDSMFFNTVEYFCFLVNNKFLSHPKALLFFADSIVVYYEKMYVVNYAEDHVKDPAKFAEFKKLYLKLTANSPCKTNSATA
jgi:hypothetical protein